MSQLSNLGIGRRLQLLSGTLALLFILMAALGHWAVGRSESHLATVFNDRVLPIEQLGQIRDALTENRTLLLQAEGYQTADAARAAGEKIAHNAKVATDAWDAYMATYLTPEEKVIADRFAAERAKWVVTGLKPAIEALARGESVKARELATLHSDLLGMTLATGEELIALQVRVAKEEYAAAQSTSTRSGWLLAGTCILGAIIGLIFSVLITRSITLPVDALRNALVQLADRRDLTVRLTPQGRDECASMAIAFNKAMDSLDSTLSTIQQQSLELSANAVELAGASRTIREGTQAQSEAASATAASVEELAVSVSHVAENACHATELAGESNRAAGQGTIVVKSASDEMSRIAEDVRVSSGKAQSLAQRSDAISGIVQVIKDVADQTNLLALNAAIEAARAGEQGRGFAVVADEVRKLAERTARSAAEITELIDVVQTDTRSVVATMEGSIGRVEAGVQMAQQAAQVLDEIRVGASGTSEKINEIATATREQSTASNDIARHVERIAQMTEENSAAASQSAALSERLESLANTLRDAVTQFKTA